MLLRTGSFDDAPFKEYDTRDVGNEGNCNKLGNVNKTEIQCVYPMKMKWKEAFLELLSRYLE